MKEPYNLIRQLPPDLDLHPARPLWLLGFLKTLRLVFRAVITGRWTA